MFRINEIYISKSITSITLFAICFIISNSGLISLREWSMVPRRDRESSVEASCGSWQILRIFRAKRVIESSFGNQTHAVIALHQFMSKSG